MRSRTIICAVVLSMLCAAPASAEDSSIALRELRALQSVARAGVTYGEYQRRVLDARIIIDRYLSAQDPNQQRRTGIARAADVYVAAMTAWNTGVTGSGIGLDVGSVYCPPAMDALTVGLKALNRQSSASIAALNDVYRTTVPIYWGCASEWIAHAEGGPTPLWMAPKPPPAPQQPPPPLTDKAIEEQQRYQRERLNEPHCPRTWNGTEWIRHC